MTHKRNKAHGPEQSGPDAREAAPDGVADLLRSTCDALEHGLSIVWAHAKEGGIDTQEGSPFQLAVELASAVIEELKDAIACGMNEGSPFQFEPNWIADPAEPWKLGRDVYGIASILAIAGTATGMAAMHTGLGISQIQKTIAGSLSEKAHKRDREAKEQALRIWHDERAQFKSKADAAPKIAGRVNMSPDTVRRWLRGA